MAVADLTRRLGKLGKESVWAALTKGGSLLLFVAINAALARSLGREGYGAWSYYFSILNVIYLFSLLGINDSTRIHVARDRETGLRGILRAGGALRFGASGLFGGILLFSAGPLAAALQRPDFSPLFRWGALFLVSQGLVEYLKAVFEGLHRIKFNFMVNMMEYGSKLLLIIFWVAAARSSASIVGSYIAANAVVVITGFAVLFAVFIRNSPASPDGQSWLAPVARYSLPMFALTLGFLIATEIDTMMLGWIAGDAEVGKYAPAKQLSAKLPHFGALVAMGALQIFANTDPARTAHLRRVANKLILFVGAVYLSLSVFILIAAPYFMPLLFGAEFAPSAQPMRLLTPFIFIYGTSRIVAGIVDYRGRAAKRAVYLTVSTVLNVILNLVLIPRHGAAGAAVATSLSYAPYLLLSYLEMRSSLAPPRD